MIQTLRFEPGEPLALPKNAKIVGMLLEVEIEEPQAPPQVQALARRIREGRVTPHTIEMVERWLREDGEMWNGWDLLELVAGCPTPEAVLLLNETTMGRQAIAQALGEPYDHDAPAPEPPDPFPAEADPGPPLHGPAH